MYTVHIYVYRLFQKINIYPRGKQTFKRDLKTRNEVQVPDGFCRVWG